MKIKKELIAIAITAFALLFVPVATTFTPTIAHAQAIPEDQNGVQYKQPFSTFTLQFGEEYFDPEENFIGSGSSLTSSIRLDFEGKDTPSLMMTGYFKLSPGSCTNDGDEEVSPKMNGGPHNDAVADDADTMDLGLVDFEGQNSRFRQEDPHPDYFAPLISGVRNDDPTSTTLPLNNGRDLCTTSTKNGFLAYKVNLDDNCDGVPDRISVVGYADPTGLFGDGTPRNNWELTFKREYTPAQLDKLEGFFLPQVAMDGHPEDTQQTWRIDQQSFTDWTDGTPNYQFVSLKQVKAIKNSCPTVDQPDTNQEVMEALGIGSFAATTTTTTTTTGEEEGGGEETQEGLTQTQDPQSEDNNDTTPDDNEGTGVEEEEGGSSEEVNEEQEE